MSEFVKKVKNPFHIAFTRVNNGDGTVSYRTYFSVDSTDDPTFIETVVSEKKAAADGVDVLTLVDHIKVDHYNKITDLLHTALFKELKFKE